MSDPIGTTKALVNRCLERFGYRLTNTRAQPWQPTLAAGLRRLAARRPKIATLIDVGAAEGAWTREFASVFPACENFLLIEAQSAHRPALQRFAADFPQAQIVMAAAGAATGDIWFEVSHPFGGVAANQPDAKGHWQKLAQTTIDLEVAQRRLPPPYLIKLDTHGYELPILAGSQATLAQTEALIVECYNFDIAPEARRFPAFCQHMESLGFRCIDLWDPLYRPGDGALWQFDLLFVRTASPEFAQKVYG